MEINHSISFDQIVTKIIDDRVRQLEADLVAKIEGIRDETVGK